MMTLCPLLCNFCKIFSKIIFPEVLVICSAVIGSQSVFEVVSPSSTVPCIKYLISLVLNNMDHWHENNLRCVLQICGWVIVGCCTLWYPSWHSWVWEHYQVWHPWIERKFYFHILTSFSFFCSRSPWLDSMLIIGWFFQAQNSGYPVTRLCPM